MRVVLKRDDLAAVAGTAIIRVGTEFERLEITPVDKAARDFVAGEPIDVCEIPVVTLLRAIAAGEPVALLPVTALGRIAAEIPESPDAAEEFGPINHVVGVRVTAAAEHPETVLALYDALSEAAAATGPAPAPVEVNPVGFAALRGPVTDAARQAYEHDLLSRPIEFDELIERTCGALGVRASRLGG
ncbi:hypothetical protein [Nocardia alni]|uniref:hypothetical protein n=1 Tax=Nocardia alni TaxID=2815723 RepID=UPI001C223542|nr:hypothetical protein [Nocardia alni]